MITPEFLWMAGAAFLAVLVLTPIIRDIFHAYNVVDRPGYRKVHAYPIPRLGGIAIAIGYAMVLVWSANKATPDSAAEELLWKLLPGTAVILLTGLLDDFFNMRPAYKLGGQVAAAALAFGSGFRLEAIGGISLPFGVSFVISMFWLLLVMNAFNLIDGLDGLCAGTSFVGALTLYAVARLQGNLPLEQITLPLMGALLGFLCYNFSRATMFLGDSGSLLIGFLIGCAGLLSVGQATKLSAAVPLMAVGVPVADLSLAVIRRFLNKRPIFSADRGHVHHRLLDRGLSPRRVTVILYSWATAGGIFAILTAVSQGQRWQPVVVSGCCITAWIGIWRLRYSELTVAARKFFGKEPTKGGDSLRSLAKALEQSNTEDGWWDSVVAAAREAGWAHLVWIRNQSVQREQVLPNQPPPTWSFSLTLSEGDTLQIHGSLIQTQPPMDILAFAEVVRRTFASRIQAPDRRAVSE